MFEWSHKLRNKNQVAMFNVASLQKFAGFLDHPSLMLHLHGLAIVQQFIHQHHLATKSSTSPPKSQESILSIHGSTSLLLAIFTELLSASHELTWWNPWGLFYVMNSLQLDSLTASSSNLFLLNAGKKTDWKHQSTPWKTNMSPENHWLVQMYFLLK